MLVAHIRGVPLEELLPLAASAGTGWVLVRAWLSLRLRPQNKRKGDIHGER